MAKWHSFPWSTFSRCSCGILHLLDREQCYLEAYYLTAVPKSYITWANGTPNNTFHNPDPWWLCNFLLLSVPFVLKKVCVFLSVKVFNKSRKTFPKLKQIRYKIHVYIHLLFFPVILRLGTFYLIKLLLLEKVLPSLTPMSGHSMLRFLI